jgi:hypothetical protein
MDRKRDADQRQGDQRPPRQSQPRRGSALATQAIVRGVGIVGVHAVLLQRCGAAVKLLSFKQRLKEPAHAGGSQTSGMARLNSLPVDRHGDAEQDQNCHHR